MTVSHERWNSSDYRKSKHDQRIQLSKPEFNSTTWTRTIDPLFFLFPMMAFIFDIDGTLVDSNELHVDSWDRAFRHFGKEFSRDKLRTQIGKGSDQYIPEFLTRDEIKRFGKKLDDYRSELFRKEYLPKVRPFPKVLELFQRIRDDNKRIMLASSGKKKDTKYYIDLLKVDDLIDGYVSGDDADSSKPAPDIFAASLKKLGNISPADAVTVGDTKFDVEAAGKAGLKTIGLLCGGTSETVLREAGAVAIYNDPADLLAHYDDQMKRFQSESMCRCT
jgi:HAD superfamily hydrolase (TIGR01509 family)